VGAVAAEVLVDFFEASDEVEDMGAWVGAAGCGAKMCAAAKGARVVDEAAGGFRIEHRANAVITGGEGFSTGGAEGVGGDEGFSVGELWCFTGEFEMTTVGAEGTGALERAGCEVGVDFSNFAGGCGFSSGERIGCGHGIRDFGGGAFFGKDGGFPQEVHHR
jgi:hypothetical protein